MENYFVIDDRGYLRKRESADLEYKENFHRGDDMLKYIKTLVGMANNKGGRIIFGVKNSPHIPVGMGNSKFTEMDPSELEAQIRQFFAPAIDWKMETIDFEGKTFGILSVKEADTKPVVCCKSKNPVLREGAIYYRYRGESREIGYPELRKLLDAEREKERVLWISHIQKIATIGPANVEMLDVYKGEITVNERKVLIDKELIKKIKFVREGHFVEKDEEGVPTLKLVGDVEGIDMSKAATINPNDVYVLLMSDLQKELSLNQYQIRAVIYEKNVKGNRMWHLAIKNGKLTIHKYTKELLEELKRELAAPDFLPKCIDSFKKFERERKKSSTQRAKIEKSRIRC